MIHDPDPSSYWGHPPLMEPPMLLPQGLELASEAMSKPQLCANTWPWRELEMFGGWADLGLICSEFGM